MKNREEIEEQIERAEELLKMYSEIPTGGFGTVIIEQTIDEAKDILDKNDTTQFDRLYKKLENLQ